MLKKVDSHFTLLVYVVAYAMIMFLKYQVDKSDL